MDKQPFYGILAKNGAGKQPGVMLACGITEPCPAFANPDQRCTGCTEYALVSPFALASLESEVATLTEAIAAKDEVFRRIAACPAPTMWPTTMSANCLAAYRLGHEHARKEFLEDARVGLSHTRAAARQLAEEAAGFRRVKELVADIRERLSHQNCEPISILEELEQVIAQVKAGEPHA